jgi:hypothetical protein
MEIITLQIDGAEFNVKLCDYVPRKLKALREFGYDDLTYKEVEQQAIAVAKGEKLNVIGMIMQGEIKEARDNEEGE